jgi:hypothetical protein
MEHRPSLPVEIFFDIFKYLRPVTITIGDDAAWNGPPAQRSWWDTTHSAVTEVTAQDIPVSEDLPVPVDSIPSEAGHPYKYLLVLRQ